MTRRRKRGLSPSPSSLQVPFASLHHLSLTEIQVICQ